MPHTCTLGGQSAGRGTSCALKPYNKPSRRPKGSGRGPDQDNGARPRVRVRLAEGLSSDGRESYLRANVREENGILCAHLAGHQGSGNLLSIVQANALLIIPAGVKSLATGKEVDAWLL